MSQFGMCYKEAFDLVMHLCDIEGESRYQLVHGIVDGMSSHGAMCRVTHAWIEDLQSGEVLDYANGRTERLPKPFYYEKHTVSRTAIYTYQEALLQNLKHQHYGPWEPWLEVLGEI